jgi:hypothetical protein
VVAAVVLAGLVLSAAALGLLRFGGVVLLAVLSVLWLRVNGPMEGVIFFRVAPDHGLTGADLAGFAGLAAAAARLVALTRSPARKR